MNAAKLEDQAELKAALTRYKKTFTPGRPRTLRTAWSAKKLLIVYWNPLLFLVGLAAFHGAAFVHNGFVLLLLPFILFTVCWVYVAWVFALAQAGYGLMRYAQTKAPDVLHYCWAACLVGALYAAFFLLLHLGIYPDEHGAEQGARPNSRERSGFPAG